MTGCSLTEQVARPSALRLVRSRVFDAAMVLWTMAFAPVALVLALCGTPERAVRKAARTWARGTLRLLGWCVGLNYVEVGREYPCRSLA